MEVGIVVMLVMFGIPRSRSGLIYLVIGLLYLVVGLVKLMVDLLYLEVGLV